MSTTCGACNGAGLCDIDGSPCGACNGTGSVEDCDDCDRASDEMERLRRELDEALKKFELIDNYRRADSERIEQLTAALESIASEFERAVRDADRPRGGQQVPPGGDFVAALRLPSFVSRARWWARELRAVLGGGR